MADTLTVEQAREAHDKREPYAVCQMENEVPYRVATFDNKKVMVYFFDKMDREDVSYEFDEKEPGRLFLGLAVMREFKGDTLHVKSDCVMEFKPNGELYAENKDYATHDVESGNQVIDVTHNWEPYPAFGHYEGIFRSNRDEE